MTKNWSAQFGILLVSIFTASNNALAQQSGSIRGTVYDKDFDAPLPLATVMVVDTGQSVTTSDQGAYLISDLPAGTYTLVFSKDAFVRQVRSDVVVVAGQLTDVDASLAGEFLEMEEFIVEDALQLGGEGEAALLALRFESPALLDSISSDLMSRAGASDAASALRLVSGTSVQNGKFAVIRGLPDRYVSSQLNGVRLPTADENTRAVELDQFPAAVIESIQVSKTFTPDQQGDASGGAVDVRLKGIPEETLFQFKAQASHNSQVTGRDDFLTYDGGGVNTLGRDDGGRDPQFDKLGENWDGAVGVTRDNAPRDYKLSFATGGSVDLDNGVRVGGFASVFYERDSSFYDNGVDDSYWVKNPGDPLTPKQNQFDDDDFFLTALFDVTRASQLVQWGGLGTLGVETENHALNMTYLYTRTAEDVATLAEDTRGKQFFFPGYDPNDPSSPGYNDRDAAPYLRTETLAYSERASQSLQFRGEHTLPFDGFDIGDAFSFSAPEVEWVFADSSASLDQPDKRQFGSVWRPDRFNGAGDIVIPAGFSPFRPANNINLGNLQRIFKTIDEESDQYSVNFKLPFEQWDGEEGYVKLGVFNDDVTRGFNQDTFSNFSDPNNSFDGDFSDSWSAFFFAEQHVITESLFDVDYNGTLDISAWYSMFDLPLSSTVNLIAGARFESTDISVVNEPEAFALWFPDGATQPQTLEPGESDVDFGEDNVLPSLGLVYSPLPEWTFRAAYSQTLARQTFKELTPILQQEFLGGQVFIGNPDLGLSQVENFDLRADYKPYEGALLSLSLFHKNLTDPIEYVQRPIGFVFTTAVNYPEGSLSGFEVEARQSLGRFWDRAQGLSLGLNATFIESNVTLPEDEQAAFALLQTPISDRDASNAPAHLYNAYLTYDLEDSGTQLGVFYTVRGDTLVAGAGESDGNFVPDLYARQFGTLNLSLTQRLAEGVNLQVQVKNLLNPDIQEVYRSEFTGADVVRSSFTRGVEFSFGLNVSF